MAVLTYRLQPTHPKLGLKRFVRCFCGAFGQSFQWGWVMEWQLRGVIHFHLFFERGPLALVGFHTEELVRRGQTVNIVRGAFDDWLVRSWIRCVSDSHPDFLAFQRGGICELLRSPDAAGRYIAKEAGKRAQKELPEGIEAAGRWWWLSPVGKPQPTGVLELARWPYEKAYKYVFDVEDLKRQRFKEKPLDIRRLRQSGA